MMTDQEFDEFFEELNKSKNEYLFNLTEKSLLSDLNTKITDAKMILRELIIFRDMDDPSPDDKTEQYLYLMKKLMIISNLATALKIN